MEGPLHFALVVALLTLAVASVMTPATPIPKTLPATWSRIGGVTYYTVSNPTDQSLGFVLLRAVANGMAPSLYGSTYSYACYPFDGADYFDRQPGLPAPTQDVNGPFPIVVVSTNSWWPWKSLAFLFVVPAHGTINFYEYWTGDWDVTTLTAYVVQPMEVAPRTVFWSQQAVDAYRQVNPGSPCATTNPYDAGPVLRVQPLDSSMPTNSTYQGQTVLDGTVGAYRAKQVLAGAVLVGLMGAGAMWLSGRKQKNSPRVLTTSKQVYRHHAKLRGIERAFPRSVDSEVLAEMRRRAARKRTR